MNRYRVETEAFGRRVTTYREAPDEHDAAAQAALGIDRHAEVPNKGTTGADLYGSYVRFVVRRPIASIKVRPA